MKYFISFLFCNSMLFSFSQNDISSEVRLKYETSAFDAIFYADSILNVNNNLPDSVLINLEHFRALSYLALNNNLKTIELYNNLLPRVDERSQLYVKILLNLSNANVSLSNYTDATDQAIQALSLSESYDYVNLIASSHNALSFIHFKNNDFKKSFEYLEKTVELYLTEKDSIKLASTYNNIAIIFNRKNDFKKSLEYNKKALKISLEIKDWIGVGKSYSNIGRVYELKKEYSKAINYYHYSINNNSKYTIINSIPYRNIGDVYHMLNNYDSTNRYYNHALNIELSNNNQSVVLTLYNNLLTTAIKQNKFENALVYQSKVDSLNKLKFEHENNESLKMLENQYKLVDSQKELQYQKEQVVQMNEINFKNKIIFLGITASIILLFLFLFQRIKNSKLKVSKEKLIMEQKVLRAQMNPHFIFNALSAIQNSLLDNDPIVSATYLSRFAKLIRQNFDFISQKSIILREEIDALTNYLDTQRMRFEDRFDYEIRIAQNVDADMIEIPPLLLQPFVENAIEHGFKNKKEKGKIVISVSISNNYICYQISDNGIGYSIKNKDNKLHAIDIFKKRLQLIGSKDEKTFKIKSSVTGTVINFCLKQ